MEEKAEEIRNQIEEIIKKGNYEEVIKKKKVSAYRVYKKEMAEAIKIEFPKMNNSERQ